MSHVPGPRRWARPYGLGPLRFPIETTTGERVFVIRDETVAGVRVMESEDGRKWTTGPHGLKAVPLP